jgi:NADP-dependent 3-hydroxy acid dehydrogenase YdfG
MSRGTAVVTGASSGIGAATAQALSAAGFDVVVGARRLDKLAEVAEPIGARVLPLDVTDPASVTAFCDAIPQCSVLVNNAGGAMGLAPIRSTDEADWAWMYETNVLGTLRVTQGLLPKLEASGDGLIIMMGSVAGFEVYPGGAGYHAAKFGVRSMTRTLRLELNGLPIRVTELDPGMVKTPFSDVRFKGDTERAAKVYAGVDALTAHDIAECVRWVATLPSHMNIDEMTIRPRDQAAAHVLNRRPVE